MKLVIITSLLVLSNNLFAGNTLGTCTNCNKGDLSKKIDPISKVVDKLNETEIKKPKLRYDLREKFCNEINYYYHNEFYDYENVNEIIGSYLFRQYADWIPLYDGKIFTDEETGSLKEQDKYYHIRGWYGREHEYSKRLIENDALKKIESMCKIPRPLWLDKHLLPGKYGEKMFNN